VGVVHRRRTEESAVTDEPATNDGGPGEELPALEDVDYLLQTIVWATNQPPGTDRTGITLYVSGSVISGQLISRRAFYDGMADEIDEAVRRDTGNEASAFGTMFRDLGREQDEAPDLGSTRTAFLHLAEARVFASAGPPIPTNRGVFWRGRLSSIDGWNIGFLGVA
jgi:hypothetical protein